MGDRISIQFVKKRKNHEGKIVEEKSVVLFSHWGGMEFAEGAQLYAAELIKEVGTAETMPLQRLEPDTVMLDFIRTLVSGEERVMSGLYLGATENDGDNSDNGHHLILLEKAAPQKGAAK